MDEVGEDVVAVAASHERIEVALDMDAEEQGTYVDVLAKDQVDASSCHSLSVARLAHNPEQLHELLGPLGQQHLRQGVVLLARVHYEAWDEQVECKVEVQDRKESAFLEVTAVVLSRGPLAFRLEAVTQPASLV